MRNLKLAFHLTCFAIGLAAATLLGACALPPPGATPAATQSALASSLQAIQLVDQAVLAATAAVNSGALKGQDAKNTLLGLQQARMGLSLVIATPSVSALPPAPAAPASGVTK